MSTYAIRAERLGKQFHIMGEQKGYETIREKLTSAVTGALARVFRPSSGDRKNKGGMFWALKDLDFEIRQGDVVGIIGRNGAGKSTLLKVLSRITEPTTGFAEIRGRMSSLLEVGTGFHPELTGRENIYLNAAILGMRRAEIERKFDEIVAFSEVERFIETPVKHYSSGMYLRLAFAVAAHLEPDILLVDEVLAVGDASFQKKCLGKMEDVAKEGRTVLFVSHNMGAIRSLCNTGIVLNQGEIIQSGDISASIETYYRMIGALGGKSAEGAEDAGKGFSLVSLNGGHGNTVSQSGEFTVTTRLHVDHDVSGFSLFCYLEDMQGRLIVRSRQESTDLGFRTVPLGTYGITIDVPPLWLNPGLYSLYFKVLYWGERASAKHLSDKFPLDVEGVDSHSDAILHPHVSWKVAIRKQVPQH
ncbi:MAG TPA: ABC transporter ATP-binding protein [Bacteroidota bacterium]|nr:ABC transporter ATP-binding protein [Bacteroidota bacterium]